MSSYNCDWSRDIPGLAKQGIEDRPGMPLRKDRQGEGGPGTIAGERCPRSIAPGALLEEDPEVYIAGHGPQAAPKFIHARRTGI